MKVVIFEVYNDKGEIEVFSRDYKDLEAEKRLLDFLGARYTYLVLE